HEETALMPPEHVLPTDMARLIDDLRGAFERGWMAGTPPQLEQLVRSVSEEARATLFRELLSLELDYRQRQDRPLTADEAAVRFVGWGDGAVAILAEFGLEPSAAHLTIRVAAGPHAGESFRLQGHNTFLVGRGAGVHLSLPQDLHLSRVHLMVEFNPRKARIVDAGSKHGTFLNGKQV